jgi:endonuclease-8
MGIERKCVFVKTEAQYIWGINRKVMPEGPSIVILKEQALLFNKKKVLSISGNSKIDLLRMQSKKVLDFRSWGKHFLICFKGFFLRIHLLMFGSYRINEKKESAPRISFLFENGELNLYNCSVKMIEGSPDDLYDWERDTMSPCWNPAKALASIKLLPETEAGDVLLNQEIFAGSGNIIKNEVLFLQKIHPETKLGLLSLLEKKALVDAVPSYCQDFYIWKKAFVLRKHWQIYRARECPVCHLKVSLRHTGKTDRRSFFCTYCQPLRQTKSILQKAKKRAAIPKSGKKEKRIKNIKSQVRRVPV